MFYMLYRTDLSI